MGKTSMQKKIAIGTTLVALLGLGVVAVTGAAPEKGPVIGADVIVGDLYDTDRWGEVGGITAYSVATTSCNVGDEPLPWVSNTNEHPVIGQNMYRLKDGRMEQVGMSWLKHGFTALAQSLCDTCQNPGTGSLLGVGCSDPYSASLNGDQNGFGGVAGLGPRYQVNASTGFYNFPYFAQGMSGDAIYKRLQVDNDDLEPTMNSGARYFIEGHYVTAADALAGNQNNNASYREVTVGGSPYNLSLSGSTQREKPATEAWLDVDPTVEMSSADVTSDGRLTLAANAYSLGGSMWRYEYALHNLSSHRSAGSLTVSFATGSAVQNAGFHAPDYHSGEPYDGTAWPATIGANTVTWATDDFGTNEDANALRWGTTYNFWFDAGTPPVPVNADIGLFRPGSPTSVSVSTTGPGIALIFADGFDRGVLDNWSSSSP